MLAGDLHYNIVLYPRDIIRVIGKPNLSNVEPSKTARVDANVYYVYGHVDRPGVYSMNGRHITLRDALAGAAFDLSRPGSQRVTLLRRKSDGTQWMVLNNVLISDLTTGHISDPDVSPGDQVNVIPENPTRRSEGGR